MVSSIELPVEPLRLCLHTREVVPQNRRQASMATPSSPPLHKHFGCGLNTRRGHRNINIQTFPSTRYSTHNASHCALFTLFTLYTSHASLRTLKLRTLHFTLHTLHSVFFFSFHTSHFTFDTPHFTLYALRSKV